jgi:hypothetical protein
MKTGFGCLNYGVCMMTARGGVGTVSDLLDSA